MLKQDLEIRNLEISGKIAQEKLKDEQVPNLKLLFYLKSMANLGIPAPQIYLIFTSEYICHTNCPLRNYACWPNTASY